MKIEHLTAGQAFGWAGRAEEIAVGAVLDVITAESELNDESFWSFEERDPVRLQGPMLSLGDVFSCGSTTSPLFALEKLRRKASAGDVVHCKPRPETNQLGRLRAGELE